MGEDLTRLWKAIQPVVFSHKECFASGDAGSAGGPGHGDNLGHFQKESSALDPFLDSDQLQQPAPVEELEQRGDAGDAGSASGLGHGGNLGHLQKKAVLRPFPRLGPIAAAA